MPFALALSFRRFHCRACRRPCQVCLKHDRGNGYCSPACRALAQRLQHRVRQRSYAASAHGAARRLQRQRLRRAELRARRSEADAPPLPPPAPAIVALAPAEAGIPPAVPLAREELSHASPVAPTPGVPVCVVCGALGRYTRDHSLPRRFGGTRHPSTARLPPRTRPFRARPPP